MRFQGHPFKIILRELRGRANKHGASDGKSTQTWLKLAENVPLWLKILYTKQVRQIENIKDVLAVKLWLP